ncbi:MAG: MMPL family transporter [Acidobacteria bacterium]|nr:MMPL family transporter [Acidobacteriota bacterium]
MRRGLLPRLLPLFLVRLGRRHPIVVCLVSLLVCVAAVVLGIHVRIDTDVLSLMPNHDPVIRQFKITVERFGSVDLLLVVVRLPSDGDLEAEVGFADRLAAELRRWDSIDWVEYRLEDPALTAAPLLDRATLLLPEARLEKLLDSLDDDGLQRAAERIRAQLLAPQGIVVQEMLELDPMGLLPELLRRARLGGIGVRFDPGTGCLIDPARRFLLMLAKPTRPAQEVAFDRQLAAGLPSRVQRAEADWRADGWEGKAPQVEFAGGYITALDDGRLIVSDLGVGVATSFIGVMLLFLLAFRRPAALGYAFAPLAVGLALTFIFVAVVMHGLNSATSAFAALLIGLGIDFVIVLYGRYVEERIAGSGHEDAVDAMGRHTGVGVLLGAVTTAATFYAFLITDFRGLSDLGLLTGTGILLFAATVFLLLPALLTLRGSGKSVSRRLHLHSFGSDMLCRLSLARPKTVAVIAAVVTVSLGAAAFRLQFDDDIRNMRSAGNKGVILRQEIMKAFGLRFTPMMIRIDGTSEDDVMTAARRLLPDLRQLEDGETLAGVDTIAGMVPSRDQQLKLIRLLNERRPELGDLETRFKTALENAGLNPDPFLPGIRHLEKALSVSRPLSLSDLQGTSLARVVDRYFRRFPSGVSTVIYCYPPAGKWRRNAPPALERLLSRHPEAVLTGANVVSAELRQLVWKDAARAAILGMVLVTALLAIDLGGIRQAALALVPLAIGVVWMLGAMALAGIRMNLMNIFVLTMIIGIGVDYGVHLLHRWRESEGDPNALAETAKAIAVAALTTVVGFGSLVLSHFPGLRSIGATAILGAVSTAVLSITVLPVLLSKGRSCRGG